MYAEIMGDSSYCGDLAFRILDKDSMSPVSWMFTDTTTMEYWMDLSSMYYSSWTNQRMVIEVTLVDYPDVVPVFQLLTVRPLCPDSV